jgi:hypothetical protein
MSVKILIFCQSINVGLCYINKSTGHSVCFFFQGGAKGMGGGPGGMFGFGQSYLTWIFGSNDLTMVAMVTIPVIWVCVSITNIKKPSCKILFENTENYIKMRQELTSG